MYPAAECCGNLQLGVAAFCILLPLRGRLGVSSVRVGVLSAEEEQRATFGLWCLLSRTLRRNRGT